MPTYIDLSPADTNATMTWTGSPTADDRRVPLDRCVDLPLAIVEVPAGADGRPWTFEADLIDDLDLAGAALVLRVRARCCRPDPEGNEWSWVD